MARATGPVQGRAGGDASVALPLSSMCGDHARKASVFQPARPSAHSQTIPGRSARVRCSQEAAMALSRHSVLAAAVAAIPFSAVSAHGDEPAKGAKKVSKSGIAYLSDDQLGPPDLVAAIKSRRAGGKLLNLDRILLHSPNFAKGWNGMFGAIRNQLSLSGKLRELAIMQIGVLNKAEYEWAQHEGEFLKAGGTREQLNALRAGAAASGGDPKLFDEAERATLALTREMTQKIDVSPATMKP